MSNPTSPTTPTISPVKSNNPFDVPQIMPHPKNLTLPKEESKLKQNILMFMIPLLLTISAYVTTMYALKIKNKNNTSSCITLKDQDTNVKIMLSVNSVVLLLMLYIIIRSLKLWSSHKISIIVMMLCFSLLIFCTVMFFYTIKSIKPEDTAGGKDCVLDSALKNIKILNISMVLIGNLFMVSLYFVTFH